MSKRGLSATLALTEYLGVNRDRIQNLALADEALGSNAAWLLSAVPELEARPGNPKLLTNAALVAAFSFP